MSNNGWKQAEELADKHASTGGRFVKLADDGERVVGAFVGEPYAREVHWTGEKYEECTGEGCKYCGEGKRSSLRVLMNFYIPEEHVMKIIEGSRTWFMDVLKIKDKYGLDAWLFEIERHGESGDPKTNYTILPEEKLTEEQIKEIASLKLHDLRKAASGESDDFNSYDGGGGKGIDARIASSLAARLKALPREAVDLFLKKFDVQRIKDLKASDEKAAKAFAESLEAKYRRPLPGNEAEVDPFE